MRGHRSIHKSAADQDQRRAALVTLGVLAMAFAAALLAQGISSSAGAVLALVLTPLVGAALWHYAGTYAALQGDLLSQLFGRRVGDLCRRVMTPVYRIGGVLALAATVVAMVYVADRIL